ncbi:MAG: twin-arginine translocation signal domain-containing protein [Pirellulales bacterium]
MFEKVNQMAEQMATSVSRRQFLGRLGRGALVAAGVVGGFLAFGSEAQAGKRVCGADSVAYCAGRVVGAPCGSPRRPGHCVGNPCKCV